MRDYGCQLDGDRVAGCELSASAMDRSVGLPRSRVLLEGDVSLLGCSATRAGLHAPDAHFASDVIDTVQRGFSESQLWLTLVAEAAIPTFVIGLAAAQRPRLGRLDALAAAGNAYSYDVVLRGGNTQIAAPKRTP